MTSERFFCSEAARERAEPIFATAPQVETWLLVENSAAWSAKSLPDGALPDGVRNHLAKMQAGIPRSRRLMIRQCHSRRTLSSFFAIRSSEHQPVGISHGFGEDEELTGVDAPAVMQ